MHTRHHLFRIKKRKNNYAFSSLKYAVKMLKFINIFKSDLKNIMKNLLKFTLVITAATFLTKPALAEDPQPIGQFGEWQAFSYTEDGQRVCYMAAKPKPENMKGKYSQRGDVFALITHRPGEGTKNVFSYITGYTYKPGSDTTVNIDGNSFLLFTQDDTAWAPDADTDNKLADHIRKGSKMVVTGTSSRGTLTTDTYSLRGSSAAHDAITKACNS